MRPPFAAFFLLASLTPLAASAKDLVAAEAPSTALRSSLEALKNAAPETVHAALAPLSQAASRVNATDPAAAAALQRFKAAVAAAAAADPKTAASAVKDVGARGDELLAALEGSSPAAQVARRFVPADDKQLVATHADVRDRALKVMGAGFGTAPGAGSIPAPGPTLVSPGAPASASNAPAPFWPSTIAHGDLGIAVPGPATSASQAPSRLQVFATEFEQGSFGSAAYAAWERMRPLMIPKPPGMPSLVPVARASAFSAEAFAINLDLGAFMTEARASKNDPVVLAAPAQVAAVKVKVAQAVEVPSAVKLHGVAKAVTIEPVSDGVMPLSSRAKAIHTVEGGGGFEVNGVSLTGSIARSTVGNSTYKMEAALGSALKVNASFRSAGGPGNMGRSMGAGLVSQLTPADTIHGTVSVLDEIPGSRARFINTQLGYVHAFLP